MSDSVGVKLRRVELREHDEELSVYDVTFSYRLGSHHGEFGVVVDDLGQGIDNAVKEAMVDLADQLSRLVAELRDQTKR
jgi:hypothetical protein